MPGDRSFGRSSIEDNYSGDIFDEVVETCVFDVPRFLLNEPSSQLVKAHPQQFSKWTQKSMPATNKNLNGPLRGVKAKLKPKGLAMSKHGIIYPSLPALFVRKLASRFQNLLVKGHKMSIKKETLQAMLDASNRFFEQLGYDLRAYAQHANRRKIQESDVIAVMKR